MCTVWSGKADLHSEILGNNIGLNAKTAMLVPESKIPNMILGSKLAFMNWIWYLCYMWCLKGVLLCVYWKLTCVNTPLFSNFGILIRSR